MSAELPSRPNRRASRRLPPGGQVRVECRPGCYGLGHNIAIKLTNVSEMGVRLTVKAPLEIGEEVEIILLGSSYIAPVKRIARVVWTAPLEGGQFTAGLNFSPPLDYPTYQRITTTIRELR
jgi:hypothetical protein